MAEPAVGDRLTNRSYLAAVVAAELEDCGAANASAESSQTG
jgi:hypothetical protein